MDLHKILISLTTFNEEKSIIDDDELLNVYQKTISYIPENILIDINHKFNITKEESNIRLKYIFLLINTLDCICNEELSKDNALLSVFQFRKIKTAIEIIACLGIKPCLLPGVGVNAAPIGLKSFKIDENINIMQKHQLLSNSAILLCKCFRELIIRPALLPQLGWLLASLLQLSCVPFKKPEEQTENSSNPEFKMTHKLYAQFIKEQEDFKEELNSLIQNSPLSLITKELMVLNAVEKCPKWLKPHVLQYLSNIITQPTGVSALILAICDDVSNLSANWDKLNVAANLIAASHGADQEKYYNAVCPQIIDILTSKNIQNGSIIANCCIKALYNYKPDICIKKIMNVVMAPFLVNCDNNEDKNIVIKTEEEVSNCIDYLAKCFITSEAEFKSLPTNLLVQIALPLLYLHCKIYKGVYVQQNKIRQLILKILSVKSSRRLIFSIFLNCEFPENRDIITNKINFSFGPTGGIEITPGNSTITFEELLDSLYELIKNDADIASDLFIFLLKILPEINEKAKKIEQGILLENSEDAMQRIEKQLISMKLLSLLSAITVVQERQLQEPEPLLEFIKSLFQKIILDKKNMSEDEAEQNTDVQILFMALMLVKLIIVDKKIMQNWSPFEDFINFINQKINNKNLPENISLLLKEIEYAIKHKQKCGIRSYQDLSSDNKQSDQFDKAVMELSDSLLPVRAHGIITLTKLIDNRHPDALAMSDFLLGAFQANLTNDDSFLYLAAINGITALSSTLPEKVIEALVEAFIDIPKQNKSIEIFPETRAKFGEILVKTTRNLGEMTPKYKGMLVNAFLNGVRDPEPLVRASSLSCLGEFCKIMGFRLGNLIIEILYCIGCIIQTDKDDSCRRAAVMVATLLLKGLGKDALTDLGDNLLPLYKSLKHLRDNDKDPVLKLHAQLALEEFDDIVQQFLFAKPKLEKTIYLP